MNQALIVLSLVTAIILVIGASAQSGNDIEQDVAVVDLGHPTYDRVPEGLSFSCQTRGAGYYADPETRCQVWHWCLPSGQKFSFLCPNGTVFNQNFRVCDWWYNVDCSTAVAKYSVNDDLYRNIDGTFI